MLLKLHHYIQQPGTSPLSTTFNIFLIYVVNLYYLWQVQRYGLKVVCFNTVNITIGSRPCPPGPFNLCSMYEWNLPMSGWHIETALPGSSVFFFTIIALFCNNILLIRVIKSVWHWQWCTLFTCFRDIECDFFNQLMINEILQITVCMTCF